MDKVSIVTATYNREKMLPRVYNSLINQTYKNIQWIIIDDGSKDNTKELVERWKKENKIEIIYSYQENQGKHIAINNSFKYVNGYYYAVLDSDDEIIPNAIEILVNEWEKIEDKEAFVEVAGRCYKPEDKKLFGGWPNKDILDSDELEGRFVYRIYDKFGLCRSEVIKKYPSPEIKGKFFPEAVIQGKYARKYKTRYINIPLKAYYKDANNAITKSSKAIKNENIYLFADCLNNDLKYFKYDKKEFIKSIIGISMCGFNLRLSLKEILNFGEDKNKKFLIVLGIPFGLGLYLLRRKNEN